MWVSRRLLHKITWRTRHACADQSINCGKKQLFCKVDAEKSTCAFVHLNPFLFRKILYLTLTCWICDFQRSSLDFDSEFSTLCRVWTHCGRLPLQIEAIKQTDEKWSRNCQILCDLHNPASYTQSGKSTDVFHPDGLIKNWFIPKSRAQNQRSAPPQSNLLWINRSQDLFWTLFYTVDFSQKD